MTLRALERVYVPQSPRFSQVEEQMREVRRNLDGLIRLTWRGYRAELRYQRAGVRRHEMGYARSEEAAEVMRTELLHLFNLRHTAKPRERAA